MSPRVGEPANPTTSPSKKQLESMLMPMLNFILDFLFPRRSLSGEEGMWITEEERKKISLRPVLLHREELTKRGLRSLDSVIAAGTYDNSPLLRRAILTFKYKRVSGLGADLGSIMAKATDGLLVRPQEFRGAPSILCPVPLHWTRKFSRGFNQAEVLSEEIGRIKGWKTERLLRRIRPTGTQTKRHRSERLTSLAGAFSISQDAVVPQCVILVDDLCTTGATLEACASELKAHGAKCVIGLVTALG